MVGGHKNRCELKAQGANIIATGTKHTFPILASYKGVWGIPLGKF